MKRLTLSLVAAFWVGAALASEDIADKYPQSVLYNKPVEVIPHVWTSIGATAPPTYENAGHNNNLSFIITGEGVVVVNSGASYMIAQALHDEIRKRTDQEVKLVILENAHGHAMLGNNYWIEQGVPVLAHADAAADFERNAGQEFAGLQNYAREKAEGTVPMQPTETFTDKVELTLGDFRIEVLHLGPAHSPGDVQVWLPNQSLLIAGDIAYQERLLPIMENTCTSCWIETWDTALEPLGATYVIPGHGHPTNMDQVRRYTRDYLVWLRERIGEHLDEGGDLTSSYYVDQSPFAHLDTFNELATRNAGRVFAEMEWE